jgi:hypothetical protein
VDSQQKKETIFVREMKLYSISKKVVYRAYLPKKSNSGNVENKTGLE